MVNTEILKTLSLDMSERENTPIVHAVRGEKNSRKVRFDLFNGGVQWEIDQNASILISYKKADGHGGMYDVLDNGESAFEFAEDSTNSVIITLAEQVLTTVGNVPLLVSFVVDNKILSTFNISLDVSENPGIGLIESKHYFAISAVIDAAVISAQQPVKVITVSEDENGEYKSDYDFETIMSMKKHGIPFVCFWYDENVNTRLVDYIEDDTLIFSAVSLEIQYTVVFDKNGSIECTAIRLAKYSDIGSGSGGENNGQNFPTDAVLYSPQNLTNKEQAQARKNIGACSIDDIPKAITPPDTATVGQTIVVKEVDENGKPILWEAADLPPRNEWVELGTITLEEDVEVWDVDVNQLNPNYRFCDELLVKYTFLASEANSAEAGVQMRFRSINDKQQCFNDGKGVGIAFAIRIKGQLDTWVRLVDYRNARGVGVYYSGGYSHQVSAVNSKLCGINLYGKYMAKGSTATYWGRNLK